MKKLIGIGFVLGLIVLVVAEDSFARGGGRGGGRGRGQGMQSRSGNGQYGYGSQTGYGNQANAMQQQMMQQRMIQYRYGQARQGYGMMQQQRLRDGSGQGRATRGGQAGGMQGMSGLGMQGGLSGPGFGGGQQRLRDGSCANTPTVPSSAEEAPLLPDGTTGNP